MKNYRDLIVWKKSRCLLLPAYKVTEMFPKNDLYGLTKQIRNSCVSILANLTRGFDGEKQDEIIKFLQTSITSISKLDNYFRKAHDLYFLNNSDFQQLTKETAEIMCMLTSFIKTLHTNNVNSAC